MVYLWRILYWPGGFRFPLLLYSEVQAKGHQWLLGVELGRELGTMAMLAGCAIAAGRTTLQKVASFLFLFGVWDIFYYFWLRVTTELSPFPVFPATLGTWDILFLIPVPWTGPVYAPMVVAATMALSGLMLIFTEHRGARVRPDPRFWVTEAIATLMILGSFLWNFKGVLDGKVPSSYPWWLLLPGEIIGVTAFLYVIRGCLHARG